MIAIKFTRREVIMSDKIAKLKQIVENCQYAQVEGQRVDLYSASAICKVYDALSEENRSKYESLSVWRMADIAFKLLK